MRGRRDHTLVPLEGAGLVSEVLPDTPFDLHELGGRGTMPLSAMQAGHGVQVTALRAWTMRGQPTIERHTLAGAERPYALQAMQGHGVRVGAPRSTTRTTKTVRVHRRTPRLMRTIWLRVRP